MDEWPIVEAPRDTPPAGDGKSCFWCGSLLGDQHEVGCVCVVKKVRLRYIIEVDVDVPHSWTNHDILFHRNDSSWCANNGLDEIHEQFEEKEVADGVFDGCICDRFTAEIVGVVDTTPRHSKEGR